MFAKISLGATTAQIPPQIVLSHAHPALQAAPIASIIVPILQKSCNALLVLWDMLTMQPLRRVISV